MQGLSKSRTQPLCRSEKSRRTKRSFSNFTWLSLVCHRHSTDFGTMSRRPLLDIGNPFYSSTETASTFLRNVRGSFVGPPASRDQYLLSFLARLVYPSAGIIEDLISSSRLEDSAFTLSQESLYRTENAPSDDTFASLSPTLAGRSHQSLSTRLPEVPVKRPAFLLNHNGDAHFHSTILGVSSGKRKYASISSQSTTFSDLYGSPKRMRSSLTLNQSSFEVAKAEPFIDLDNLAHLNWSHSDGSGYDTLEVIGPVSPSDCIDAPMLVRGSCLCYGFF